MPRPAAAGRSSVDTREKLLAAAQQTLEKHGFAGTTARAIARAAGINPALIFYHYGTLNDLLLAVVDRTGEARLEDYRAALAQADDLPSLVRVAADLYRRDLDSGYATVLAEMIGGSLAVPGIRSEMLARLDPWLELGTEVVQRASATSPVGQALGIDPAQVAEGLAALYLGMEVMTHLDGNRERFAPHFQLAQRLADLYQLAMGSTAIAPTIPTEHPEEKK